MYRWIAILAAAALAVGAAYGQSSSPVQPSLPLGQSQMMTSPMMHGGGAGMDSGMAPMMQMMRVMHMIQMRETGMMDPGAMGQDMMSAMMCRGSMPMIDMEGSAESHLAARLAFVKSELAIDQAQEPAWQAYAAALRAEAKPMSAHRPGMQHAMANDLAFPARFDGRMKMLEAELSSLKAVRDEAVVLYGQLSAEQREKADRLLAMPLCM